MIKKYTNLKPDIIKDLMELRESYKIGVWHGVMQKEKSYEIYMSEDKARERFMYNSGHDFGMFLLERILEKEYTSE